MKLRGFGDIIGFQQSGIKYFKMADPLHHADLFKIAEENVAQIEDENVGIDKFNFLLKLYDKADIIGDIKLD